MKVLAGDIGGTKALLAVVEVERSTARVLCEKRSDSGHYAGLGTMVRAVRAQTAVEFDRACFGVPGPIVAGECQTLNLPWTINVRRLAHESGIERMMLINDFPAALTDGGWAVCPGLPPAGVGPIKPPAHPCAVLTWHAVVTM